MAGFDVDAVLQIFEGDKALGSGYDLGNGRVLTARHVIERRDENGKPIGEREQVFARRERDSGEDVPLVVSWRGADEVDVAVLCPDGQGASSAPPRVEILDGSPLGRQWCARGFPVAFGANAEPVEGSVPSAQDERATKLRLLVEAPPSEAKDWKGLSGAAVFVGDRLFGVISVVSKVSKGSRLEAMSIVGLLMADEALREAVGLPPLDEVRERERKQREGTAKEIAGVIESTPGLRSQLGNVAAWQSAAGKGSQSLADAIVVEETSPVELIDFLHEAMAWLDPGPEGARLADAIRNVLWIALPIVGGPSVTFERETEDIWVMNADFDWMVESRTARDDGRSIHGPEWRSLKFSPQSRPRLPRPTALVPCSQEEAPEGGADAMQRVADASRAIGALGNPIVSDDRVEGMARYLLELTDGRGGAGIPAERMIEQARSDVALAAQRSGRRPGRTYYTILQSEKEGEGLPVIAKLIAGRLGLRVIVPRMQPKDQDSALSFRSSLSRFFMLYLELIGAQT